MCYGRLTVVVASKATISAKLSTVVWMRNQAVEVSH